MLKRFFCGCTLFVLLGFSSIVLMGCDAMTGKAVTNSLTNSYSSTTTAGVLYTFYRAPLKTP